MKQKFPIGTLVKVKRHEKGSGRSHFSHGLAIVVGSHSQEYGGGDVKSYTLLFEHGISAWYPEEDLKLVSETPLECGK